MATPIDISNTQDWDEPLNVDPMFTSSHIFSTDDITVTFGGLTVGSMTDSISVFDTSGANGIKTTKDGATLYPIDSEFGYIVSDFTDADMKELDGDYAEGWAGDLTGTEGEQLGLVVSNAPTDTFKTPAVLGTWLGGLGGETVKASSEHYTVMQNVLSDQKYPGDPDALYPLDNALYVIGGEYDGRLVTDVIAELGTLADNGGDINDDGIIDIKDVLAPNETEISENIAASSDYSVTLKDDGKLLYRWGNVIKKPNDVRIEAALDLPDEWSNYDPYSSLRNIYIVAQAELVIHHTITNNPNDQVRPEDFENEAAIGILPTYEIISDYNEDGLGPREVWATTDAYYAGDGTLYEAGTILKDEYLAAQAALNADLMTTGLSVDLAEGYTNAWYTTMDREPFEPVLNEDGTDYAASGPRWRLQPDKYGQDLPSVVIPQDPTDVPPPTKDEVKYEVGSETQTVLNLLDWGYAARPLSISAGWQDLSDEVSINGMNYSSDFDVAVYIKGDIKPATIYSAELLVDYEQIYPYAVGADIVGTDGDDYLIGLGNNVFTGGAGSDLFVLSYGSSLDGVDLSYNIVTDYTVGVDSIGFIDLGIHDENFAQTVLQVQNGNDLELWLDQDGADEGEATLVATLSDVVADLGPTGALVLEEDFLLTNPSGSTGSNNTIPEDPAIIVGTDSDDVLNGTLGDDVVYGYAGNDSIYALAGDDILDGGSGLDRLYGATGADSFVFAEGTELDIVYDFEDGVDMIVLGESWAYEDLSLRDYNTGDTMITIGDDRMILRDVSVANINEDDFILYDDAFAVA